MKDESVFSFAGIWNTWKNDGKELVSCAIITTTPNELLEPVHNRMPVILHSSDFENWLSNETKSDDLTVLLRPFPVEYMQGYPVSTDVNSPSIDNQKLVNKS